MIPAIDYPEANVTLERPKDMTAEQCYDLQVWRGVNAADGSPLVVSKWQLSAEDLKEINEKGVIYLGVIGHTMPPVWLVVESPFEPPSK